MARAADLRFLSATEARAAFLAGRLSPVELLQAQRAAAEALVPRLNCFTQQYWDEAEARARRAEARFAAHRKGSGPRPRPLEGIPFGVKEGHGVAGQPWTDGSLLYEDRIAAATDVSVARLLKAGANQVARTTAPEFACITVTHSRANGVTRNPWNPAVSPGGSGGGAAAALGAGLLTVCEGSDYGGSIRIPAGLCGLVGFRPPAFRVPEGSGWLFNRMNERGPLARSVADCLTLYRLMAGPHLDDPMVAARPRLPRGASGRLPEVRGWRIAYSRDFGGLFEVEPEVAATVENALPGFAEAGCLVEPARLEIAREPFFRAALSAYRLHSQGLVESFDDAQRAQLSDYVRRYDDYFARLDPWPLDEVWDVASSGYRRLAALFRGGVRALVTPTLATTAVPADLDPVDGPVTVDGRAVDPLLGWALSYPVNLWGTLPSITLPCGLTSNGVPLGLQIVGRPYDEAAVFALAAAFEAARPFRDRPWLDGFEG
ncbi:amidase/aspartyl-tRNA(Asn)/glutamyl-tRNA(Gln) amidotransferase subunit A [Tistlia consotensis]|uniref:Amidase/aspartyl-tRNA(Asn)/glutamyl-tRNA(Gln) amidotransferase subunit A n=1 Tax=Tistlia consotensis USBA 355 TaxID=560819 RepID=A0A1Y6BLG6_9PROT|nr:amidase [Tistlia consotensis]SMF17314.1 amidase/aspartyl-tRNA(Asn)/glutamyl-tRNA(Gln) amidotransferase subunit A [Tistlia consotensis USBA 355]SNR40529.1 amidase/aspartyl-tRNA(Asn)/glutamyl-tRNA(Gln) amidotransferase subunit A [Tistlia consotensis]